MKIQTRATSLIFSKEEIQDLINTKLRDLEVSEKDISNYDLKNCEDTDISRFNDPDEFLSIHFEIS